MDLLSWQNSLRRTNLNFDRLVTTSSVEIDYQQNVTYEHDYGEYRYACKGTLLSALNAIVDFLGLIFGQSIDFLLVNGGVVSKEVSAFIRYVCVGFLGSCCFD